MKEYPTFDAELFTVYNHFSKNYEIGIDRKSTSKWLTKHIFIVIFSIIIISLPIVSIFPMQLSPRLSSQ